MDSDKSNSISLKEFQDALAAMKIQVSNALVRNLVALFDQDGDSQINLGEFER